MKSIVICILLLTTILAVRSEFRHVANKSGDIVIQTTKSQYSSLFLKGNVFADSKLQSIQDIEISNLISHVMGLLPLNKEQKDRSSFPNVSLFNKPKLNLLFTIDSISKESLKDFTFLEQSKSIEIEKSYFPMDSIAELATIATGVTPDLHGIVGDNWFVGNEKVQAYEKKSGSLNANVADVLSQSFNGKSLVISASANKKFTSAMSVHNKVSNKNAFGFYSNKGMAIDTVNSPSAEAINKLMLTPQQVESTLYSKEFKEFILPSSAWSVSMKSGIFHITSDNGKTLFFNLDAQIDNAFLTELVMLFHTVQTVKNNPHFHKLALDNVPDMMSFAFTAPVESTFSEDIYRVAIAMINNAMSSAYSSLSTVYGRVACEVIALAPVENNKDLVTKVTEALQDVAHPIKDTFPHVYLKSSHKSSVAKFCDKAQEVMEDVKVHCVNTFAHYDAILNADSTVPNGTNSTSSSSDSSSGNNPAASAASNQVAAFQIFLFFPIIWVLFIVGGALLMMKISSDAQRDTLLYRNTERQY